MPINKDWARWIKQSVAYHFKSNLTSAQDFFIEGDYRLTTDKQDYYEFRFDGPRFTEVSHNYFYVYCEVNILCTAAKAENDGEDIYRIDQLTGEAASGFVDIPIYKIPLEGCAGIEGLDQLGCLRLIQNEKKRERVQIFHFGQIDTSVSLIQATVEGHYNMNISI